MISRRPVQLVCLALLLVAAAPPAGPTAAQQAELRALGEKLGTCHRTHATAAAATKASVDRIVASTLAACEAQMKPIRSLLAEAAGADQADKMMADALPRWRDAIRRIVGAARAGH
jgi:hypothetical protein